MNVVNRRRARIPVVLVVTVLSAWLGCEKRDTAPKLPAPAAESSESTPTTPAASERETLPPSPAESAARASAQETPLTLTGLSMMVPNGWISQPTKPGPVSPKAAYSIPDADGETSRCTVHITHFPHMKTMQNMEEQNIKRWLSQVLRADGQPSTPSDAKIEVLEMGPIRLTIVDLTGTVAMGMRGMGAGSPNHRMIAAILNHPRGPHFVKVTGPVASMKAAEDAIFAFLKSAKVN